VKAVICHDDTYELSCIVGRQVIAAGRPNTNLEVYGSCNPVERSNRQVSSCVNARRCFRAIGRGQDFIDHAATHGIGTGQRKVKRDPCGSRLWPDGREGWRDDVQSESLEIVTAGHIIAGGSANACTQGNCPGETITWLQDNLAGLVIDAYDRDISGRCESACINDRVVDIAAGWACA